MVKKSRIDLAHGIPLVDRGRGDPRNIMAVILYRNENNMYTICVKSGIPKSKHARNQFDLRSKLCEMQLCWAQTLQK